MRKRNVAVVAVFGLVSITAVYGAAFASTDGCFTISIDETSWKKWGFCYPATYVFDFVEAADNAGVLRRRAGCETWTPLEERTSDDFFNGIECVRFDKINRRAYVSVGFHTSNNIRLMFANLRSAKFNSVAKYYDNRKAAYTLSNDNWARRSSCNPGAPWRGMADDASDKYQAAIHACRQFHIPVTIAVNNRAAGGAEMWKRMQEELDRDDSGWEPAVHTATHPCSLAAYSVRGYRWEILGCRDEILAKLENIPYGQHVFTFILPCGYQDAGLERTAAGEFLFLRDWNNGDNLSSTDYSLWNSQHRYYGIGGFQTVAYDAVLQSRRPAGRYYASDVAALNSAFDRVYEAGGVFYAMWHSDRYQNSVIHDMRPGADGVRGSTLMRHLTHVANRRDVWYVANGWLYCYRFVAENVSVRRASSIGG